MDQPTAEQALKKLEPLVGTWKLTATPPGGAVPTSAPTSTPVPAAPTPTATPLPGFYAISGRVSASTAPVAGAR